MLTNRCVWLLGIVLTAASCTTSKSSLQNSIATDLPQGWCVLISEYGKGQCIADLSYACSSSQALTHQLHLGSNSSPVCGVIYSKQVRFPEGFPPDQVRRGMEIIAKITSAKIPQLRQSDGSELPKEVNNFIEQSKYVAIATSSGSEEIVVSFVMQDFLVTISDGARGIVADYTIF